MEKTTKKITKTKKNEKISEEIKDEEIKEVKKDKKTKEKASNINKTKKKIFKFLNNPLPIIIALVILCVVQLFFLFNMNKNIAIYTGELNKDDLQIVNLHIFTNNDINYFYASPAAYLGEDKEIYNFEMGYYVEYGDDEYLPFATRSRSLDNKSSLREIVDEMSAWNFFETSIQDYFFSREVLDNLDDLHFMIKASSTPNSTDADIVIDYPIEVNKITK